MDWAAEALRLHRFYGGKLQTAARCPVRDARDWAVWYTPGVAAVSRAIAADHDRSFQDTCRGNTIAIVSDGTRVLGLGDIGPEAAMPVMEGKALLFKLLGDVDAVPICLATKDADEIVRTIELLQPSFAAINLEDVAQPKCFRILERLRERLAIPVWHDDQQGTATVVLGALWGALERVGKRLEQARVALVGTGAAGVATFRLLCAAGLDPRRVVACDSQGILGRHRRDLEEQRATYPEKWALCSSTNPEGRRGGIREALREADVCVAFSRPGPGVIAPEWIRGMAGDAIVFACANPTPEIWPDDARAAGARIVATGRSDLPNQVNNSLAFPGIFRGALDVRATALTDEMGLAAARALAESARERGLRDDCIVAPMDTIDVVARVAAATGCAAIEQGIAREPRRREELIDSARRRIAVARGSVEVLAREGLIPRAPDCP
jgi:malate dehydrogenase (oxaloacetate-decarboxylating)